MRMMFVRKESKAHLIEHKVMMEPLRDEFEVIAMRCSLQSAQVYRSVGDGSRETSWGSLIILALYRLGRSM